MNVKIIFNDKTEIIAQKNGNCYILDEEIVFPDDLTNITIISEEGTETIDNATIQPCASVDEKYWFIFVRETEEQKQIRELKEQNDMLTECILEISEIIYG